MPHPTPLQRFLVFVMVFHCFCCCKNATSQSSPLPTSVEIEKMIVGKWKGRGAQIVAKDWKAYDKFLEQIQGNEQQGFYLAVINSTAKTLRYNFNADKTFSASVLSPFVPKADNKDKNQSKANTYEIKQGGGILLHLGATKETTAHNDSMKVLYISEDTLIMAKLLKSGEPAFAPLLQAMHTPNDTNKTVAFVYTFSRIKEPKIVKWEKIETKGLPSGKAVGNIVVSGTKMFGVSAGRADGEKYADSVFESDDNGVNWVSLNEGLPKYLNIVKLVVNGAKLFMSTTTGETSPSNLAFYAKDMEENSWKKMERVPIDSIDKDYYPLFNIPLLAVSNKGLIASFNNSIWLSENNGLSWKLLSSNLAKNLFILGLYARANMIIASGFAEDQHTFIYLSLDGGATWNDVQNNLPINPMVSAVSMTGTMLLLQTQYGLFTSANAGNSWNEAGNGFPELDNTSSPSASSENFAEHGNYPFFGCNNGVFYSPNSGKDWIDVSNDSLRKTGTCAVTVVGSDVLAFTTQNSFWKARVEDVVR